MKKRNAFVCFSMIYLCGSQFAFADCSDLVSNFEKKLKEESVDAAGQAVEEISLARDCGPEEARNAKRVYSHFLVKRARDRVGDDHQREALIRKAAGEYNEYWGAWAAQGEFFVQRRDYVGAAESFIEALSRTNSDRMEFAERGETDPLAPSEAELSRLVVQTNEARQLAAAGPDGKFVGVPDGRNVSVTDIVNGGGERSAEAFRLPVPITFKYDSVEFTSAGKDAADELVLALKALSPSTIVVTGHTDAKGSVEYNVNLSKRRAERVAVYLADKGITSQITTEGKGKSLPRRLSDPSSFSQDQIDELNRRVEFDWSSQ